MSGQTAIISRSAATTFELGRALGGRVMCGDVLGLCGPLGAGKTQFVKGLAAGLGVPEDGPVVSPTFVLVREYAGVTPLAHVDAYRLRDAAEFAALDLEAMQERGVVAIEWADRVQAALPVEALWIEFEYGASAEEREIVLSWSHARWDELRPPDFPPGSDPAGRPR